MKRYNNLYKEIYDIENLKLAHIKASKGKGHYSEIKKVNKNLDARLLKIQIMLKNKTYKTSKYKVKTVNDNGKNRTIRALPYYPDRIIQWAIMLVIEKVFIKTFIADTYSAIPNRGIHKALYKLKKVLKKEKDLYCLKLDIKKYYDNINHKVLKSLLRKKFKDNDLLILLDEIIDSMKGSKGIPIGNYTSQYFANFYLSYFDHWIKEDLGIKHYFRYMDDIIILDKDKTKLHDIFNKINSYVTNDLKLIIKSNWQVFPVAVRGIDFIGYRFFNDYILLRKSIAKRFKRTMIKFKKYKKLTKSNLLSIGSYYGWLIHCNGYNLFYKYIKGII